MTVIQQPAAEQMLVDGVLAFQRNDIETCKRRIVQYWQARSKGAVSPITVKNNVMGDDIAKALLTLVNSRMYPYDVINKHPTEKCDDC
jgi:hypothetical protein